MSVSAMKRTAEEIFAHARGLAEAIAAGVLDPRERYEQKRMYMWGWRDALIDAGRPRNGVLVRLFDEYDPATITYSNTQKEGV